MTYNPREIDPEVREFCCECAKCPSGYTTFNFHAPPDLTNEVAFDTAGFTCPRGHVMLWRINLRCTCEVDRAGYTVDSNHPAYIAKMQS